MMQYETTNQEKVASISWGKLNDDRIYKQKKMGDSNLIFLLDFSVIKDE